MRAASSAAFLLGLLLGASLRPSLAEDPAVVGSCSANGSACRGADVSTAEVDDDTREDGMAKDIVKLCPVATTPVRWLIQRALRAVGALAPMLKFMNLWPAEVSAEGWADSYTSAGYLLIARVALGVYKTRTKDYVNVPDGMHDPADVVRVENIHAPHWDPDGTPNFYWFESALPSFVMKTIYTPLVTCFYSALRRMSTDTLELNGTFNDDLNDPMLNTWQVVLANTTFKKPVDWVMSFYDIAHNWEGTPIWPKQMTNFQTYWKHDVWDDQLEHAIAFYLIGSHRVELGSWKFDKVAGLGEVTLPFRLPLLVFSKLAVREHFGRYGCDMYFDQDGLPALIETPAGELVARGDKHWQYWKFVWRSTLVTGITLVDHLHLTHFRASNVLARSVRASLTPNNPIRRMASIFSFGAIFVNMQAMHTLIGPNHMLHRATPFKEFTKLSALVPASAVHDVVDVPPIKKLLNDTMWDQMDPKMKEIPFYSDGRLVMNAIKKLWRSIMDVSMGHACNESTQMHQDWWAWREEMNAEIKAGHYQVNEANMRILNEKSQCHHEHHRVAFVERVAAYSFIVTAWHRHVGFVGDYYADPALATMSWREGEAVGRPRQHMIMTLINVFTSTNQPLLKEDYTHLFKGMEPDLETEFTGAWKQFIKDLDEIDAEIDRRNEKRKVYTVNMLPRILEGAVSK